MVLVLVGVIKGLSLLTEWLERRGSVKASAAAAPVVTSNGRDQQNALPAVAPPPATTTTTPANVIATPATDNNALLLRAKAEALAALVLAGKVGETEGIKLVYGVGPSSSNPRYLEAREALKAAMVKQAPDPPPKFRPLTPEQQKFREEMGLSKH